MRRWELLEELEKAKKLLMDKAKSVLFDSLDSKSESTRLRAAETVMRHSAPPPTQEVKVETEDSTITVKSIFGIGE